MKKTTLCALLLVTVALTPAIVGEHIGIQRIPPEADTGDLFLRASKSSLVVVGVVVKRSGVQQRLSDVDRGKRIIREPDQKTAIIVLDDLKLGTLYDVRVEETLCRQTDFEVGSDRGNQTASQNKTVSLFVPRDEPEWTKGTMKEHLLKGHRYLLFIKKPDPIILKEWLETYQLEPQEYYRGEGQSRGIVPLGEYFNERHAPKQSAVLEKVTRLCQAVRHPELAKKLAALDELAASGDTVLQKEAEAAAKALRSAARDK